MPVGTHSIMHINRPPPKLACDSTPDNLDKPTETVQQCVAGAFRATVLPCPIWAGNTITEPLLRDAAALGSPHAQLAGVTATNHWVYALHFVSVGRDTQPPFLRASGSLAIFFFAEFTRRDYPITFETPIFWTIGRGPESCTVHL